MNIKGRFVTLRAVSKNDLPMMCELLNDPIIESLVIGWSFPISMEQQIIWYEKTISDSSNQRFVIETLEEGAVGIATLVNIDWKNRCATHGIKLLNKERKTKGIGTDAVMALMRYAFDELGLNRLETSRFEDNIPSQKLYTKCGWQVEGIRRKCVYKNGEWKNLVNVGILIEDYHKLLADTSYWKQIK